MRAVFGIIGYPLTQSFSPDYFNRKFSEEGIDAEYLSFPLADIGHLPKLLADQPHLKGFNITIPYKSAVIPYLDVIDDAAAGIGAVNCVALSSGRLIGYNTDISGFHRSMEPLLKPHHTRALVLGTGGSSLAVQFVLKQLGIDFVKVSRSRGVDRISYEELPPQEVASSKLIINTTPLGMYPQTEAWPPIPYGAITGDHLLFDLIYNPAETAFLKKGKAMGAATQNGLDMLYYQAEANWDIWKQLV